MKPANSQGMILGLSLTKFLILGQLLAHPRTGPELRRLLSEAGRLRSRMAFSLAIRDLEIAGLVSSTKLWTIRGQPGYHEITEEGRDAYQKFRNLIDTPSPKGLPS